MPKSLQAQITAADNLWNEYHKYRKVQLKYFGNQTIKNLNDLRDQGKMLEFAADKYQKERDIK